jgi:hypothetical protein
VTKAHFVRLLSDALHCSAWRHAVVTYARTAACVPERSDQHRPLQLLAAVAKLHARVERALEDIDMAKVGPFHSKKPNAPHVHHDNNSCKTGNNIEPENKVGGTGGRPLCDECSRQK